MSRQSLFTIVAALTVASVFTVRFQILQAASSPQMSAQLLSSPSVEIPAVFPTGYITIELRNTGSSPWIREGFDRKAVNLGTVRPDNGNSPFYDPVSWHSANRIALREPIVSPGEVGTFSFRFIQPGASTNRQQFRMVQEHVGWFGPVITVSTAVVARTPDTGASLPVTVEPEIAGPLAPPPAATILVKRVDVNLRTNTLTTYENDVQVASYPISPGKSSTPTPVGTFKVQNKTPVAYSKSFSLYMPYWNAFTANGAYGIHGLPYWKTKNGGRIVEGASHIGKNVSHGCIRLGPGNAEAFYGWADPGTSITIHR